MLKCCPVVVASGLSPKKRQDMKKKKKKKIDRMWACVEATDCVIWGLKMKGLFKGRKHIEAAFKGGTNNICSFQ